jgi:hypothetical protein
MGEERTFLECFPTAEVALERLRQALNLAGVAAEAFTRTVLVSTKDVAKHPDLKELVKKYGHNWRSHVLGEETDG